MSSVADMPSAIDRLVGVLAAAGLEPAPTDVSTEFDEFSSQLAPRRLPIDLRQSWSSVDPARLGVLTYPRLLGARRSLADLTGVLDMGMPNLIPIMEPAGGGGRPYLAVEPATEESPGGAVVEVYFLDNSCRVVLPALWPLVEVLAECIEAREWQELGGTPEVADIDLRAISRFEAAQWEHRVGRGVVDVTAFA